MIFPIVLQHKYLNHSKENNFDSALSEIMQGHDGNIPKFMEYTWISSSIRTEYDSDDKLWSDLTKNYKYKQIVEDNGHLDFLKKYRDITELGTGKGGKLSIHIFLKILKYVQSLKLGLYFS